MRFIQSLTTTNDQRPHKSARWRHRYFIVPIKIATSFWFDLFRPKNTMTTIKDFTETLMEVRSSSHVTVYYFCRKLMGARKKKWKGKFCTKSGSKMAGRTWRQQTKMAVSGFVQSSATAKTSLQHEKITRKQQNSQPINAIWLKGDKNLWHCHKSKVLLHKMLQKRIFFAEPSEFVRPW